MNTISRQSARAVHVDTCTVCLEDADEFDTSKVTSPIDICDVGDTSGSDAFPPGFSTTLRMHNVGYFPNKDLSAAQAQQAISRANLLRIGEPTVAIDHS